MKRFILVALSLALVLVITGCAKPPQAQIDQARQALQVAQAANAQTYAPDAWAKAQSAMNQLEQELAAQQKKLSLFRNYGKVTSLAAQVITAASQAATQAQNRVAELRDTVTKAIADLRSSLASARAQLAKVPATAVDKRSLTATLDGASKAIDTAKSQLDAGQLDSADATVAQARDSITSVLRRIEQATGRRPTAKR